MGDRPLLVSSLLEHGARYHGTSSIVTRLVEGGIHRCDWRDVHRRAQALAHALAALGVEQGDRVGTIAWNTHRHLELYYAVSGMGAVLHTLNPRLHRSQLEHVVNHAQDRVLFVDRDLLPLVERDFERLPCVRHVVVMTDREHLPPSSLPVLCYEDLLAAHPADFDWPQLDERQAAALCYTSGTTGDPKGVVYSHRSTVLHAFGACAAGALPLGPLDVVLPIVPMFHVNAWGLPYMAPLVGFGLVLPGCKYAGPDLAELMAAESVSFYAGVPTVHQNLLDHLERTGTSLPSLRTVTNGGAALTRALIDRLWAQGVEVVHGWGMTETSPIGTLSQLRGDQHSLPADRKAEILLRQGRPLFGVEVRIVGEGRTRLAEDGVAVGELEVRGPWVCDSYLGEERGSRVDPDGWFPTGDVARILPCGDVQITDRQKDLVKSGGEWISSLDLEEHVSRHPEIAAAAVIAVPDEKWGERPLLIAVAKPGTSPRAESVLAFLADEVARFWIPDRVIFVDALPLGATGKVQKAKLRELYGRPDSTEH